MSATQPKAVIRALFDSVVKGVQCDNEVYRFFDPGISLLGLRDLPIVRQQNLISFHYRWDDYRSDNLGLAASRRC